MSKNKYKDTYFGKNACYTCGRTSENPLTGRGGAVSKVRPPHAHVHAAPVQTPESRKAGPALKPCKRLQSDLGSFCPWAQQVLRGGAGIPFSRELSRGTPSSETALRLPSGRTGAVGSCPRSPQQAAWTPEQGRPWSREGRPRHGHRGAWEMHAALRSCPAGHAGETRGSGAGSENPCGPGPLVCAP